MKVKFFTVRALGDEVAATELNHFLASHRILAMERQFMQAGLESCWCLCVSYDVVKEAQSTTKQRSRVDYKEQLNEVDFARYSRLRDLRKHLAEQHGVPLYALFTNEQMAAMVQQQVSSLTQLGEIPGVGPGRVEKYGAVFVEQLQSMMTVTMSTDDHEAQ